MPICRSIVSLTRAGVGGWRRVMMRGVTVGAVLQVGVAEPLVLLGEARKGLGQARPGHCACHCRPESRMATERPHAFAASEVIR